MDLFGLRLSRDKSSKFSRPTIRYGKWEQANISLLLSPFNCPNICVWLKFSCQVDLHCVDLSVLASRGRACCVLVSDCVLSLYMGRLSFARHPLTSSVLTLFTHVDAICLTHDLSLYSNLPYSLKQFSHKLYFQHVWIALPQAYQKFLFA